MLNCCFGLGFFFMITPNPPPDSGYRELLMQYDEDPLMYIAEPYCENKTIQRATPYNGAFRYTSSKPETMTEQDIAIYCTHDWSEEKEAIRQAALKLMGAN